MKLTVIFEDEHYNREILTLTSYFHENERLIRAMEVATERIKNMVHDCGEKAIRAEGK